MATSKIAASALATYAPGRQNLSVRRYAKISTRNVLVDIAYGGPFILSGTTKIAGTPDVPVSRIVRLVERKYGKLARQIRSNEDGSWKFFGIYAGPWIVYSYDDTDEFNAVISDNVFATPI